MGRRAASSVEFSDFARCRASSWSPRREVRSRVIECLGTDAAGISLTPESLFPVASITKLGLALAVLRLVEQGKVDLDALLGTYVPRSAARDTATVRTLLCHISGLPLDLPEGAAPYEPSLDWPKLAEACLKVEPEALPSTRRSTATSATGCSLSSSRR